MTTQANCHLIEAFITGHACEALAEDVIVREHAQECEFRGRAEIRGLWRAFSGGFPEVRTEIHAIAVDEGTAVAEVAFRGRQDGPFLGIPPTGREVILSVRIIFQLVDSQIRAADIYYDAGSLLRQLGLALDVGD